MRNEELKKIIVDALIEYDEIREKSLEITYKQHLTRMLEIQHREQLARMYLVEENIKSMEEMLNVKNTIC